MSLGKILAGYITVIVLVAGRAFAADPAPNEGRVTRIVQDVKLLRSGMEARPAAIDDGVAEDTAVRTGDESRSEITFVDLTITRLGANSVFSFNHAGHNVQLGNGSVLLRVPKDSGGASIQALAVTVGITGTTVIFRSTLASHSMLTILEGGARLTLVKYPAEFSDIHAGQMLDVPPGVSKIPPPIPVDLNEIMKTDPLITDFPPLPSQDLILAAVRDQQSSGPGGGLPLPVTKQTGFPSGPSPLPPNVVLPGPPVFPPGTPANTPPPRSPGSGKPWTSPKPGGSPKPETSPTPRKPRYPKDSHGKPGPSPGPNKPHHPKASPTPGKYSSSSDSPKARKNKIRPKASPTPGLKRVGHP
jgi:hypothetical protein